MLRVGIVGAGRFAEKHLDALRHLRERVRVVAVARRNPDKAFPSAEAMGARVIAYDDLLSNTMVDAICVCSPNGMHPAHVRDALAAGKHVFCEKPLALNVPDADAAIAAADEAGRVLMVGHLTRHAPLYQAVAGVLDEGRLGALRTVHTSRLQVGGDVSWRMDPGIGGGAAFDLLIHDFDLLNWFLGSPRDVVARAVRQPGRAPEYMAAVFTYPSGAVASVEGGFVLQRGGPFVAQMSFVGERGYMEVDNTNREHPIRVFERSRPEEWVTVKSEDALFAGIEHEWAEFLDAIEGRVQGHLRLADARVAVQSAAWTARAAEEGIALAFD